MDSNASFQLKTLEHTEGKYTVSIIETKIDSITKDDSCEKICKHHNFSDTINRLEDSLTR